MANTIRIFSATITVASNAGSLVTSADDQFRSLTDAGGELRQVLVKAPNTTDEFNFSITDSDSIVVFDKNNAKGKINDAPNIPMRGVYTIAFDNAADGDYTVKLILEEKW